MFILRTCFIHLRARRSHYYREQMCDDLNKTVILASDDSNTVKMLKEQCVSLFKFGANVKLDIVFQNYDPDWDALIDLCDNDLLMHKDKLRMVVQPLLNDVSSVSEVSVH